MREKKNYRFMSTLNLLIHESLNILLEWIRTLNNEQMSENKDQKFLD